eukprot:TRINITY_DN4224_c0_g1::TRINITY_DN4224_c0_g1_i1::g.7989::m.7989 TRINITY_DN4224_c0_g1::TRINITY_DN4224_c0_g1_i1::g.7989  ORF type:complete len:1009 (+),score=216.06,sp/Q7PPA5/ATC1_ANOGA/57.43/0.0,E1-E2_ATPase/PF00122.15/63,E1-E2_ATPase/PF00122.15/1e-67,E1-E2_ATPase/PF00122.15/4.1e+02,Cation_ATPase_C/PF00689.16/4.9e-46,Hydrolase/PF00702.21/2.8e-32,Hydrolase_like2/PF13246.1/1.3e-19,HAD/PF12710.2/1.2e-16,Cation_ATPase_N/PF00690.21/1.6e-16,Cation_ATPase_N/PF00690.21/3e+03,Hydrolase_3/PF08282.7/67,Hydrol
MDVAFCQSTQSVASFFSVDVQHGLSEGQVINLRLQYGTNELPAEAKTPFWQLVLKQFDDLLVKILVGAAVISFLLAFFDESGDKSTAFVEPLVIVLILIANATIGVIQENNAENAIEALKEYESEFAHVLRDGRLSTIPAKDLVPGDVVEVAVGDKIPADLRLIQLFSATLQVDQAILTGESASVSKQLDPVMNEKAVIQDKENMLFSGTNVTRGKARGIVVNTGVYTEFGKIRTEISIVTDVVTPLKKNLDEFGEFLSKVIMWICVIVWVINIGNFWNPEHGSWLKGAVYYFKIAVALAVAAIPEGLPAVVTTCLALGTMKMAKKNAIVRSLPSVETLGCTSVVCSDKTGTLTTNKMSVCKAVLFENAQMLAEIDIQGTSYEPRGQLKWSSSNATISDPASIMSLVECAKIATVCNDSSIIYSNAKGYDKVGESTEAALKVFAEKVGAPNVPASSSQHNLLVSDHWTGVHPRVATLEFERTRKMMSVVCQNTAQNGYSLFTKGAPESVVNNSTHFMAMNGKVQTLSDEMKLHILDTVSRLGANRGLRCLAIAYRPDVPLPSKNELTDTSQFEKFEKGLVLAGVVGMLDPPRPEVADAIATCRAAGIRIIVITGDNQATAEAICRQIGVLDGDTSGKSFTGPEFDSMSESQKWAAVRSACLFARTEPSHKKKLVEFLQHDGHVVAMTGDGVNDSPALRLADIGIAMGSGTAVAKEASDMVLADDDFATIVCAVAEGRAIYANTKQFIRYLISSNIGEVACIFGTAALGIPDALIPVQLLWVNLVTDGLPATALGFNPPDRDIMQQRPRSSNEPMVNNWLFFRYMVIGVYVGFGTVAGFIWWFMYYSGGPQVTWSQLSHFEECEDGTVFANGFDCAVFRDSRPSTVSLSILVTIEMFNAMNSVSENQSIMMMPPHRNMYLILAIVISFLLHFMILYIPFFHTLFSVDALNSDEWFCVIWLSFPVILIDEMLKLVTRTIKTQPRNMASRLV